MKEELIYVILSSLASIIACIFGIKNNSKGFRKTPEEIAEEAMEKGNAVAQKYMKKEMKRNGLKARTPKLNNETYNTVTESYNEIKEETIENE